MDGWVAFKRPASEITGVASSMDIMYVILYCFLLLFFFGIEMPIGISNGVASTFV